MGEIDETGEAIDRLRYGPGETGERVEKVGYRF